MQCLKDVLHGVIPQAIDLARCGFVARLRVVLSVLLCIPMISCVFYSTFLSENHGLSNTFATQIASCTLSRTRKMSIPHPKATKYGLEGEE